MQFILLSDLTLKIKENILEDILEITDTTGITSGSTLLDSIERGAIDEVNSYCNQFYDMSLLYEATGDTRDRFLVKLVIDIMLYEISAKLTPDNIPSIRQQRYDQAKSDLDKIAKRLIVPNWITSRRDYLTENTSEILYYSEDQNSIIW